MTRQRSQPHNFNDRIAAEKQRLEDQARLLPHGPQKDVLLRKIRQVETACHMKDWLQSPGLKSPD
jgi:hypothetical protein